MLWRKVRQGLSAGRVQSVATRLVVERERERMAFRPRVVLGRRGRLRAATAASQRSSPRGSSPSTAPRVATGRDFADDGDADGATGVVHLDEALATAHRRSGLAAPPVARRPTSQEKPYTRRPSAPFTTSTLQQEAAASCGCRSQERDARGPAAVRERLHHLHAYRQHDAVGARPLTAARSQARELYGAEYVPDAPRRYEKKVKNAQEAHEAIRPAGDRFRTPAQVAGELRGDEFALYELIWKRTVASQMADARGSTATVRLGATLRRRPRSSSSRASRHRHHLPRLPRGLRGGPRRRAAAARRRRPTRSAACRSSARATRSTRCGAEADGHETSPPPRYTEATLVKALEERGIGRPSTYASTIGTIQDRGYVDTRGSALVPTWLAFAVTRLLEEHFAELVDYDFTAAMEEDLDRDRRRRRAAGSTWLQRFYFGDEATAADGLRNLVDDLGEIDAREISTDPDRRRHRPARRPLRPVRRGDRPAGVDPRRAR